MNLANSNEARYGCRVILLMDLSRLLLILTTTLSESTTSTVCRRTFRKIYFNLFTFRGVGSVLFVRRIMFDWILTRRLGIFFYFHRFLFITRRAGRIITYGSARLEVR